MLARVRHRPLQHRPHRGVRGQLAERFDGLDLHPFARVAQRLLDEREPVGRADVPHDEGGVESDDRLLVLDEAADLRVERRLVDALEREGDVVELARLAHARQQCKERRDRLAVADEAERVNRLVANILARMLDEGQQGLHAIPRAQLGGAQNRVVDQRLVVAADRVGDQVDQRQSRQEMPAAPQRPEGGGAKVLVLVLSPRLALELAAQNLHRLRVAKRAKRGQDRRAVAARFVLTPERDQQRRERGFVGDLAERDDDPPPHIGVPVLERHLQRRQRGGVAEHPQQVGAVAAQAVVGVIGQAPLEGPRAVPTERQNVGARRHVGGGDVDQHRRVARNRRQHLAAHVADLRGARAAPGAPTSREGRQQDQPQQTRRANPFAHARFDSKANTSAGGGRAPAVSRPFRRRAPRTTTRYVDRVPPA